MSQRSTIASTEVEQWRTNLDHLHLQPARWQVARLHSAKWLRKPKVARDQEGQGVGRAKEKNHCPRRRQATKGGSCAACKCTDRQTEKKEGKERKRWAAQVYNIKKSDMKLEPQPNLPFLIHYQKCTSSNRDSTKCTKSAG